MYNSTQGMCVSHFLFVKEQFHNKLVLTTLKISPGNRCLLEYNLKQKCNFWHNHVTFWNTFVHLFILQVLTMVLPLLLIMVLPKLMNAADPEAQQVSLYLIDKEKVQNVICTVLLQYMPLQYICIVNVYCMFHNNPNITTIIQFTAPDFPVIKQFCLYT